MVFYLLNGYCMGIAYYGVYLPPTAVKLLGCYSSTIRAYWGEVELDGVGAWLYCDIHGFNVLVLGAS